MQNISLNERQISRLARDKSFEISKGNIIQLCENDFFLNINGEIYDAIKMDIQFKKRKVEQEHIIKFLQQLICEHFNLAPVGVVFSSRNTEEFIFKIGFSEILICSCRQAITNMRDMVDEPKDIFIGASQIGLYKQLGQSQYYFRWLDLI